MESWRQRRPREDPVTPEGQRRGRALPGPLRSFQEWLVVELRAAEGREDRHRADLLQQILRRWYDSANDWTGR